MLPNKLYPYDKCIIRDQVEAFIHFTLIYRAGWIVCPHNRQMLEITMEYDG